MTESDLIDIFFKARGNIQFFWNIYAVIILALMGWLISLKQDLSWQVKLLVSCGFIVFIIINISGQLRSYELIIAAKSDLLSMAHTDHADKSQVISAILEI